MATPSVVAKIGKVAVKLFNQVQKVRAAKERLAQWKQVSKRYLSGDCVKLTISGNGHLDCDVRPWKTANTDIKKLKAQMDDNAVKARDACIEDLKKKHNGNMKEVWKEWRGYGPGKRETLIHSKFRDLNRKIAHPKFHVDAEEAVEVGEGQKLVRPDIVVWAKNEAGEKDIHLGVIDLKTGNASFESGQIRAQRNAAAVSFNKLRLRGDKLSPESLERLAKSLWSECSHVKQFP